MIQYEKLYDLVVFETVRFCLGYWRTTESTQDDFEDFLGDVTKFFSVDSNLSSKFTAVMVFMQNTEQARIPWHARVSNILKTLSAVLFSEKYDTFSSAGELSMVYHSYQDELDKNVARKLKEELGFDSNDIAALKSNSPEIVNKIMESLVSKEPMYLNAVASYLIKID
ncbi:MAG: hypothetical protein K5829_02845 [Treponema sp.]|nr:hypothetical protein [Treponema sp.]